MNSINIFLTPDKSIVYYNENNNNSLMVCVKVRTVVYGARAAGFTSRPWPGMVCMAMSYLTGKI